MLLVALDRQLPRLGNLTHRSPPTVSSATGFLWGSIWFRSLGLMARIGEIAWGLKIILRQRHERFVAPRPCPAVAVNAADKPLAVVVDLNQRTMAVGAVLHLIAAIDPHLSPEVDKPWASYSLSVATVVDAVSRQRLTAAPSLSACALISLPR